MRFLLELHPAVSIIILSVITLTISYITLKLVRSRYSHEMLRENHEVGGFIFNAFGLIYAVLVAFVVFVTWSEYESAKLNVDLEAGELSDLYLNAEAFNEPVKSDIKDAIKNYTNFVVSDEWRMLSENKASPSASDEFHRLWVIYTSADVSRLPNLQAYAESLKHLNDLSEYRRTRLFQSKDEIPWVIWLVLWFGAVVSAVYTLFFGIRKLRVQFLMSGALTVTNTLVLYLIYILDNPFTGSMKIQSSSFDNLIRLL